MPDPLHPALPHFLARLGDERNWGQVRVRRFDHRFELSHVDDCTVASAELGLVPAEQLRQLAQRDRLGRFRPLKSAPTLIRGWRCEVGSDEALGTALSHLYPGSLEDAWAIETGIARASDWSEFTARLLGKARVLERLAGADLLRVVKAACDPRACLRRRHWMGAGLEEEPAGNKSELACLEPCAPFVAFARTCVMTRDTPTVALQFAPDDLATLAAALRHALEHPPVGTREGEVNDPLNSRRLLRVLTAHRDAWDTAGAGPSISAAEE